MVSVAAHAALHGGAARRSSAACLFLLVSLVAAPARATEPRVLNREDVVRLASQSAPTTLVAERKVTEAEASKVGAAAPPNPELSAYIGPRWEFGETTVDYFVGLAVPFDVSGAPSRRLQVAKDRARTAAAEAEAVRRGAVAEALDLWARARGAAERARLEQLRLVLDRTLLHAVEVRRSAGTVGDGDVALARVLEAEGIARATTARRDLDALVDRLRARLGIAPGEVIAVGGTLEPSDPPPLETLLSRLPEQPQVKSARASVGLAEGDEALQRSYGFPVPRMTGAVGRDPGTYLHFGLDVPVPVFQRNQSAVALAEAHVETSRTEYQRVAAFAEADLRAAYAEFEGARDAVQALAAAMPAVDDAEHLAARGYELGQSTLGEVTTSRREAAAARVALVEAEVSAARARIALDALAGTLP